MPRTPIYVPDPPADCAYTLLDTDGRQLIKWGRSITRTDARDVIATDGPQRHARNLNDRATRRYEIDTQLLSREEVDVLRDGIAACRGGAGQVAWRHPQDDAAGTAEDAPRWRFEGAEELDVTRTTGGQYGGMRVVLAEV